MYFWRRRRDFFSFLPVKSVNSRDWTGLLIQRIDPDYFILWHPSMIAGAESTIAGAELSIGGPRATPKSIQIDTNDTMFCNVALFCDLWLIFKTASLQDRFLD